MIWHVLSALFLLLCLTESIWYVKAIKLQQLHVPRTLDDTTTVQQQLLSPCLKHQCRTLLPGRVVWSLPKHSRERIPGDRCRIPLHHHHQAPSEAGAALGSSDRTLPHGGLVAKLGDRGGGLSGGSLAVSCAVGSHWGVTTTLVLGNSFPKCWLLSCVCLSWKRVMLPCVCSRRQPRCFVCETQ